MISACEETRRGLSKHVGDPTLELSSGPDRSSDSPDNYSPPIGLQLRLRERGYAVYNLKVFGKVGFTRNGNLGFEYRRDNNLRNDQN